MLRETCVVFAALFVLANATTVNKCNNEGKFEDANQVQISGCTQPPCKLKRRTEAKIEMKFVPDRDTTNVVNAVNGILFNVPLPFIGVDGTSACDNIFNTDNTKAGCSLKKGTEYIFRNSFPILPIYPTVNVIVHYELVDESRKVLACFEVPSKITN